MIAILKSKKGSLLDWLLVPVWIFIIAIFLIVSLIVINAVRTSDNAVYTYSPETRSMMDSSANTLLNMDNMMLFIILGLSIFVILSGYFVSNHPAFFFFGVIILAIVIFICAVISNTYETFTGTSTINATSNVLTKTNFLMQNLPFYICFMGFISAIAMYVGYVKNG